MLDKDSGLGSYSSMTRLPESEISTLPNKQGSIAPLPTKFIIILTRYTDFEMRISLTRIPTLICANMDSQIISNIISFHSKSSKSYTASHQLHK